MLGSPPVQFSTGPQFQANSNGQRRCACPGQWLQSQVCMLCARQLPITVPALGPQEHPTHSNAQRHCACPIMVHPNLCTTTQSHAHAPQRCAWCKGAATNPAGVSALTMLLATKISTATVQHAAQSIELLRCMACHHKLLLTTAAVQPASPASSTHLCSVTQNDKLDGHQERKCQILHVYGAHLKQCGPRQDAGKKATNGSGELRFCC